MSENKSNPTVSTVFIGGAANLLALSEPEIYKDLLGDNVGLYGHENGIFELALENKTASVTNIWATSEAPPGVAEFGEGSGYAQGTVDVVNKSNQNIMIPVGTIFTSTSGQQYQVLSAPGQPGYASGETGPNKNGYISNANGGSYILAPGSGQTLTLESLTTSTDQNIGDNEITNVSGSSNNAVEIRSSSAFTGAGSFSTSNFTGGADAPFYYLYQKYGYFPSEADVNVSDGPVWSSNDLESWKNYVDVARESGVLNVAPILSYNGLDADYSQNFATSPYWANMREAALYGGGISFDSPPGFVNQFTPQWFSQAGQSGSTYLSFIESEIKWANTEGIRTSVIISPFGAGMSDTVESDFLEQTKSMVARLTADGALPSQFIVENYNVDTKSNTFDQSVNNTESLNSVAQYLSTINTSTSNSESGLEETGHKGSDIIMSGISPTVNLKVGTSTLFASPSVYAGEKTDIIDADVKLYSAQSVSISSANAAVISQNGSEITARGTPSQISEFLSSLQISDEATASGVGSVNISLTDGSSTINGTTSIGISGPQSIFDIGSTSQNIGPLLAAKTDVSSNGGVARIYGSTSLSFSGSGEVDLEKDATSVKLLGPGVQKLYTLGHSTSVDFSSSNNSILYANNDTNNSEQSFYNSGYGTEMFLGNTDSTINISKVISSNFGSNIYGNVSGRVFIESNLNSYTTVNLGKQATMVWDSGASNTIINGSTQTLDAQDVVSVDSTSTGNTIISGANGKIYLVEQGGADRASVIVHAGTGSQTLLTGSSTTTVYGDNTGSQLVVAFVGATSPASVYGGEATQQVWTGGGNFDIHAASNTMGSLETIVQGGVTNFFNSTESSTIHQWGGDLNVDFTGSGQISLDIGMNEIGRDVFSNISAGDNFFITESTTSDLSLIKSDGYSIIQDAHNGNSIKILGGDQNLSLNNIGNNVVLVTPN